MTRGQVTLAEIKQQPATWSDTVKRARGAQFGPLPAAVLTGAGTSAYAAMAVEAAWPGSRAIASTELLLDFEDAVSRRNLVVSLARSGNSPESVAVVDKIERARPAVRHIAITCNSEGKLASWPGVEAFILSPATNDRGLAMTSSFTNLVLGGCCLARLEQVERSIETICTGADIVLREHEGAAQQFAAARPSRMVALASAPLFGAAREACLKILELTAGSIAVLPETYLGLRHGPMSFVQADTLVVCFISSDPRRRRYEMDLVAELRAKKIGRLIGLAPPEVDASAFDYFVSTPASSLPDHLRTPPDIVFCQLLAFHASLECGLDPDSPSPGGVINRVVEGVRIYES